MNRAFRPEALGTLEDRAVPSHVGASPLGGAAHVRSLTIPTPTITQSTPQWSRHRLPGGQFPSSLAPRIAVYTADGVDPDVKVVEVVVQNAGNTPVSSATMTERLPRNVDYVPGSAQPVGGGEVTASKTPNGLTVIKWTIPGPVASETLTATFLVKARPR
ncbi:MAG: hypothetical protein J0I06_19790 [Planctomycetes bacterium]|nr:hypothetical protein [Planctomycetota bacterium]